jgi:hypothetical protein
VCEDVDYIHLALDLVKWLTLANTAIKLWVRLCERVFDFQDRFCSVKLVTF